MPPALEGKDVLACAMTGSGKTAAFILPILNRLMGKKRGVTRALVLTPTRELAAQIDEHTRELAVHTPLSSASVFGGVGMGPQEHAFRTGVDILIATPGRLLDHFRFPYAKLEGLEVLVLDEADRMLDMGFLPDIRRVLEAPADAPPDALLLGHDAAADRAADARDAQEPVHGQPRAGRGAGRRDHAGRLSGRAEPEGAPPDGAPAPRRDRQCPGLHAHQAPRQPPRGDALAARRPVRTDPRQSQPDAAHGGPGRLQGREVQGPRRDGHRGPRNRRRGALARRQLRRAPRPGGLHPPRRTHGPRRDDRRRLHVRCPGGADRPAPRSSGPSASACRGSRFRASTTTRPPPIGSRCLWPSGSRRSAPARRKSASAPRRRPSAGPRTRRHRHGGRPDRPITPGELRRRGRRALRLRLRAGDGEDKPAVRHPSQGRGSQTCARTTLASVGDD